MMDIRKIAVISLGITSCCFSLVAQEKWSLSQCIDYAVQNNIQVTSFKTTGKRVFKMAPIHHHFELCEWSEKKIVCVFALVSAILSISAIILYVLFNRGIL